jgi:hypothetical protein
MPNHVTHRIKVTGDAAEIERFKTTCIRETSGIDTVTKQEWKEVKFDFNSLIPMPDEIKDSDASLLVDNGLAVIGRADVVRDGVSGPCTLESMLSYRWVVAEGITTTEALKARLIERNPECVKLGEKAVALHDKYGAINWYDWSIAHWGTKWNSYEYEAITEEPGYFEFMFQTAWSSPEPIWEKLAKDFPSLTIEVNAFDEGWGFAVTGEIADGVNCVEYVDATDELYEATYGDAPSRDDEEEDGEAAAL